MANVSEHDPKKEWKSNYVEHSRINFPVVGCAIRHHYFVKAPSEIVQLEARGRRQCVLFDLFEVHVKL